MCSSAQTPPENSCNLNLKEASLKSETGATLVLLEIRWRSHLNIQNSQKRFLTLIGLAIVGAIAAWQFYLLVVFKGPNGTADLQGGTVHLWIAILLALITCIAAFFLISSFRRYDSANDLHITSAKPPSS